MKEAQLQRQIQKALEEKFNAKVIKIHGNNFTEVGTPDLMGGFMHEGQAFAFALEVKLPGRKPANIQARRITEWRNAGYIAGWCTSPLEAIEIIEDHLRWI